MKVLVFIEQRDGHLKNTAFEALTVATKLAGSASDCAAVVVGKGLQGMTDKLAGYGADTVYVADQDAFDKYNVIGYAAAVEAAIKTFGAQAVIAAASPMGRDLLPRLAARFDAGIMTDVVTLDQQGGNLMGTKPMYAGKCLADLALENSAVQFASIRPNVFAATKSGHGKATATPLSVTVPTNIQLRTTEITKGASTKADLSEASLIISGGRAMANADNFKILHECADVIGATVGASRAAVDSGFAPHNMQVGQTGKTVNPNLYIACGISGSIQHMAGMRTSKVIVAINTDPDAAIFKIADYGIVADLFQAVPIFTKKFQELLK